MHYGVSVFPQYTTWNAMRETGLAIERWGYDSLWTWDHFLPIFGDPTGPNLEGWQVLAAWGALTSRIKIGALVSGNTYRHPAVLANMAATLDHVSNGRAVLGMGAAWFELEHKQYGIDFGKSPGDRLARLKEALPIVRSLLDNPQTTFEGHYYQVKDARCEPKPVQKHLPIMIGGGGEQKTLRMVARYADYWNGFGSPEDIGRKLEILKSHCAEAGTQFDRILTTVLMRVVIADREADAHKRIEGIMQNNRIKDPNAGMKPVVGTPESIAQLVHRYHQVGIKGILIGCPAPYDVETLERLQKEVKPRVEELAGTTARR